MPGNESPDNVAEKVRFVGKLFGVGDKAEAQAADVTKRFAALAEKRKAIKTPLRAMFILGVNSGRAMIGGTGSSGDLVLTLAGAENAAAALQGHKPLTDESLLSLAPDVVVTISRASDHNTASLVAALPGFKETPAGRTNHIVTIDAHYLLGFGPRTPQAAAMLGGALVLLADAIARVIVAPAELPIGIIMAIIGAPVFLHIILKRSSGVVM